MSKWTSFVRDADKAGLAPSDTLVWVMLASRCGPQGAWPSVARLQVDTGLGRSAVFASLKRLQDTGRITRKPRPSGGWTYLIAVQDLACERRGSVQDPDPPVHDLDSQVQDLDSPPIYRDEDPMKNQRKPSATGEVDQRNPFAAVEEVERPGAAAKSWLTVVDYFDAAMLRAAGVHNVRPGPATKDKDRWKFVGALARLGEEYTHDQILDMIDVYANDPDRWFMDLIRWKDFVRNDTIVRCGFAAVGSAGNDDEDGSVIPFVMPNLINTPTWDLPEESA